MWPHLSIDSIVDNEGEEGGQQADHTLELLHLCQGHLQAGALTLSGSVGGSQTTTTGMWACGRVLCGWQLLMLPSLLSQFHGPLSLSRFPQQALKAL